MFGYLREKPEKIIRAIARLVSVPYSISESLIVGTRFVQHVAVVGWTKTTECRRSSSS